MEPPSRSQLHKANRQEGRARKAAYIAAAASEAAAQVTSDPHGEDPPIVADPSLLIAFQPTHTDRYRDFLANRADVVSGILHATDTNVLAALLPGLPPCVAWAQLAAHEDGGAGRVGFSMHLTRSYPTTHRAASVAAVLAHLHEVLQHDSAGGGGGGGGGGGDAGGTIRLRVQAHPATLQQALQQALEETPDLEPAPTGFSHLLVACQCGPRSAVRVGVYPATTFAGLVRRKPHTPHAASHAALATSHTAHATRHCPPRVVRPCLRPRQVRHGSVQSPHAESVCKATHKLLEALQLLEQKTAGRAGAREAGEQPAGAETEGPAEAVAVAEVEAEAGAEAGAGADAGAGAGAGAGAEAQGAAVPWGTVIDVGAAPGG